MKKTVWGSEKQSAYIRMVFGGLPDNLKTTVNKKKHVAVCGCGYICVITVHVASIRATQNAGAARTILTIPKKSLKKISIGA